MSQSSPWDARHDDVAHFESSFAWQHLPSHLAAVSSGFSDLAERLLETLNDGPELAMAMRKLVEAKDCAVRQAVRDHAWKP